MRTLSREAVLVSTGMTVFSLLMALTGIVYGTTGSMWPWVLLPALLVPAVLELPSSWGSAPTSHTCAASA